MQRFLNRASAIPALAFLLVLIPALMILGAIPLALGAPLILGLIACTSPDLQARHRLTETQFEIGSKRRVKIPRPVFVALWTCFLSAGLWFAAVPNLDGVVRPGVRDRSARRYLEEIVDAQAVFQMSPESDSNRDGIGEYGSLAQLAADRGHLPSWLSSSYQSKRLETSRGERFRRDGHVLHLLTEPPSPTHPRGQWVCLAWPAHKDRNAKQCLATSDAGDIWVCHNLHQGIFGPNPEKVKAWIPAQGMPAIPPGKARGWMIYK